MSVDKFIKRGVVDSHPLQQKQDVAWRQAIKSAVEALDRALDQTGVPLHDPAYGSCMIDTLIARGLLHREALEQALDQINEREAKGR